METAILYTLKKLLEVLLDVFLWGYISLTFIMSLQD